MATVCRLAGCERSHLCGKAGFACRHLGFRCKAVADAWPALARLLSIMMYHKGAAAPAASVRRTLGGGGRGEGGLGLRRHDEASGSGRVLGCQARASLARQAGDPSALEQQHSSTTVLTWEAWGWGAWGWEAWGLGAWGCAAKKEKALRVEHHVHPL